MKATRLSLVAVTLLASHLLAQEQMRLEQISVATKTQKSIDGVAATVEVITQKEIESIGAENLKDLNFRTYFRQKNSLKRLCSFHIS
ncbi:MAG: hypothetical protein PHS10_04755 [Thiovulaceae bacterium]|nr:hypothetical protein [Sulfurimonadaceae bacterium]